MDPNRPKQPSGLPPSMRRAHGRPPQMHQRPTRPTTPPASRPAQDGSHMSPPPPPAQRVAQPIAPKPKRKNYVKWVVISVIVIVALLIAGFVYKLLSGKYNELSIKTGSYQAVFLTNNMVYFGHLSQIDGEYAKLTDIFYLQVNQNQSSATQTQQQNSNQQPQLSLTKLGGELHGPEDVMYINRKQIIFWENLKADGKVAQAIKDYQGGKK